MTRDELQAFFERREIEARRIPLDVLERARKVVERVEDGESYMTFHGKRLRANRRRVSIPLGRKWRILADDLGDRLRVRAVMSHQTYNASFNIV